MHLRQSSYFLLFIVCFIGCQDTYNTYVESERLFPGSKEIIKTSIIGQVIDENEDPIVDAHVMLQTTSGVTKFITEEDGQFLFNSIENLGPTAYIIVSASGKFDGFRRLPVFEKRYSYTEIKMETKNIIGKINARKGGILETADGASIELPVDGVFDYEGNQYSGEVNVAMRWIDPSGDDLAENMIGDLSGLGEQGELMALSTYGMLQIELLDEKANKLNLGNNRRATLKFPLPESMQSNAPSTIPLWSYDEGAGVWVEEGTATYEDGVYVGDVYHFSSWNVDVKIDPISIEGRVEVKVDKNKYNAGYLSICVESERIGKVGGWLCDDGSFEFYNFPSNEIFDLIIQDKCKNILYKKAYESFDSDTNLGVINVEQVEAPSLILVQGTALNCEGIPLKRGSINVNFKNRVLYFDVADDGYYNFSLDMCKGDQAKVKILDFDSHQQSNFIIDNSKPEWDIKNERACEDGAGWWNIAPLPNDLTVHRSATFSLGEIAIIAGGYTPRSELSEYPIAQVWEYNSTTLEWKELEQMPFRKANSAYFSIGDQGYLVSGRNPHHAPEFQEYSIDFLQFDSKTKTWEVKENYPGVGIQYGSGFSIDGKGYVIGGTSKDGISRNVWMYDPVADSWEQKSDFPGVGRTKATSFSTDGYGYYGLGASSLNLFQDFWKYNPKNDEWTQIEDFNGGKRSFSTAFVVEGAAYVGGGRGPDYNGNFYELNTTTDTWGRKIGYPGLGTYVFTTTFTLNNTGYIGRGGNQYYTFID